MRKLIIVAAVVAALAGAGGWYYVHRPVPLQFRLAKASRGDIRVVSTATGQIAPFVQVQVGTQVTGVIQRLFVDFNCEVKAGQQVAQLDPAPFKTVVDQNRANLLSAQANVLKVKASLVQAEKDLGRDKELAKKDLIAPTDLDAAVANYESLVAQLKAAEAGVEQARATLENSEVNLAYTKIFSPIDGVVIQRSVDVGQTLSASLAAPTMYIIADDMKKVQIQASVAEADIGRIVEGMDVTFTVDSYREAQFKGRVSQIRLFPTTVQNVVTYTVMIDADNPGGALLPGMTASANFEIAEHKNVLKIPNAALRFVAPWDTGEPVHKSGEGKEKDKAPLAQGDGPGAGKPEESKAHDVPPDAPVQTPKPPAPKPAPPKPKDPAAPKAPLDVYIYKADDAPEYHFGGAKASVQSARSRKNRVRLWVQGPAGPEALTVTIGVTDGTSTEVLSGSLKEGQEIITGIIQEGGGGDAMSNPFAPRPGPPGMGGPRR